MDLSGFFNDDYILTSDGLFNIDNPYDRDVLKQILDCTKNDTLIIEKRIYNNCKYAFIKNTSGIYFCQKRKRLFFNQCGKNKVNLYDILETQLGNIYLIRCIENLSDSVLSIRDEYINYENNIYMFTSLGLSGQVRIKRLRDNKTIEVYRGYDDITIKDFMTKVIERF